MRRPPLSSSRRGRATAALAVALAAIACGGSLDAPPPTVEASAPYVPLDASAYVPPADEAPPPAGFAFDGVRSPTNPAHRLVCEAAHTPDDPEGGRAAMLATMKAASDRSCGLIDASARWLIGPGCSPPGTTDPSQPLWMLCDDKDGYVIADGTLRPLPEGLARFGIGPKFNQGRLWVYDTRLHDRNKGSPTTGWVLIDTDVRIVRAFGDELEQVGGFGADGTAKVIRADGATARIDRDGRYVDR